MSNRKVSALTLRVAPLRTDQLHIIAGGADFRALLGAIADLANIPTAQVAGLDAALAALVPITQKGAVNGVASLDAGGKIPLGQLPAAIAGALQYKGTWDAAANTPVLASSAGTLGWYYKVATPGATTLDGINDWKVGDWVVFNGTTWDKIDNTESVPTVFGRVGNITAQANDYTASQVSNTPAGNIAATDVQAALNELDTEKQPADTQANLSAVGTTQATTAILSATRTKILVPDASNTAVRLGAAVPGKEREIFIDPASATSALLFPEAGESIRGQTANTSFNIGPISAGQDKAMIRFVCYVVGIWENFNSAAITAASPTALGGATTPSAGVSRRVSPADHAHDLNAFIAEGASAAKGAVPSPGAAIAAPRLLRAKDASWYAHRPTYKSACWYGLPDGFASNDAIAQAADTLYFMPMPADGPISISQLSLNIRIASAAGGKGRLAVFASDASNDYLPGVKIQEGSAEYAADVVAAGTVSLAANAAVDAPSFWVCTILSLTATIRVAAAAGQGNRFNPSTAAPFTGGMGALKASRTYSLGFPSTAVGLSFTGDYGPAIVFKVA